MKEQLNPMITAYIYKLKNRIEPGVLKEGLNIQ